MNINIARGAFQNPCQAKPTVNCAVMAGGTRGANSKNKGEVSARDNADESPPDHFAVILDKITDMCKQLGALDVIREQVTDLTKSVNFHSTQYEDYHKTVKGLIEENKATQIELTVVMNTLTDVKKENAQLREKVDELQQQMISRDVEIVGFPETPEENLSTVVKTIGQKIEVTIEPDQIEHVERLPSSSTQGATTPAAAKKPKTLLVTFKSKQLRDKFITSARTKKVKAKEFHENFPDAPVFVNERLTIERKRLIYQARLRKNANEYKYLWTKSGVIYVKKTDTSPLIRIMSETDLAKIV